MPPTPKKGSLKTYSEKTNIGSKNDRGANTITKAYKAKSDGKIISKSSESLRATTIGGDNVTSYPKKTTVLDTTGYSKGKKSFPAKRSTYNIAERNYDFDPNDPKSRIGRSTYSEWKVPRNQVKKTITEMKSNSGANKNTGTKVNNNSSGTKTVVHTAKDGKKHVKVTTKDGKVYNKVMKKGGVVKSKKK